MARGALLKKLLASYGREDEFRAVAEQIIDEEEKKNNRFVRRLKRDPLALLALRRSRRSSRSRKRPATLSSSSSRATIGRTSC